MLRSKLFVPASVRLAFATLVIASSAVHAADPEFPGVVAPAETAAHWGLGLGVGVEQGRYRGEDNRTTPLPLILYDSARLHVFGNTVDWKLPSAGDFRFALRARYALGGGYKASDSDYLRGMADRKNGLWLGAASTWHTDAVTLSASWMKAAGQSKGQQVELNAEHAFRLGRFQLVPHIGAEWSDDKYVDYYYGVLPGEATASRPAYVGKSTTDASAGLRINYALEKNQTILLDIAEKHRGGGISDSPLVDKTTAPSLKLGYLYQF